MPQLRPQLDLSQKAQCASGFAGVQLALERMTEQVDKACVSVRTLLDAVHELPPPVAEAASYFIGDYDELEDWYKSGEVGGFEAAAVTSELPCTNLCEGDFAPDECEQSDSCRNALQCIQVVSMCDVASKRDNSQDLDMWRRELCGKVCEMGTELGENNEKAAALAEDTDDHGADCDAGGHVIGHVVCWAGSWMTQYAMH